MQKPVALTIAACLGLTGCHVFEKSETWSEAVKVRPGEAAFDPDPSNAYALKLHEAFAARGVEHKIVVYQYHYTTRNNEQALGTRTAVIYRDDTNPTYPWWLKDDRLNNPFWLPNGDASKQVSFYVRRKAEVIETKDFPGHGGGKQVLALVNQMPSSRVAAHPSRVEPVTKISPSRKASTPAAAPKSVPTSQLAKAPASVTNPEPKAPAVVKSTEPKKPAETAATAKSAVTRIKLPISLFTSHSATAAESESTLPPPITSKGSGSDAHWSPPTVLDPSQQSGIAAPRDERLEKLFRAKHGTEYNRFSPTDRRKMQQLEHEVASRD